MESGPYVLLDTTYGAWFFIHAAYSYLMLLLGTLFLISYALKGVLKARLATIILAVMIPWIGRILYTTEISSPSISLRWHSA